MEAYARLFKTLKDNAIVWCSWKSNEHLDAGLEGKTDIDFLFYEDDRQRVTHIFHECGFIIFQAPYHRAYPNVIDAIVVDSKSGRILHAHSHFLLVSGEKYLKSYILPWNEDILKNRIIFEIKKNIYTSSPAHEAILLVCRESLKIRWRDKLCLNPDKLWGGEGFRKELEWLKIRTTPKDIERAAEHLLDKTSIKIINDLIFTEPNVSGMLRLCKHIKKISEQKNWRRMDAINAVLQAWINETFYIFTRLAEKTGIARNLITRRRTLSDEGAIIVFIGPDGSGKSTVTKTLVEEWQHKIDVSHIYFGIGDSANNLWQRALKAVLLAGVKVKSILNKLKTQSEDSTESSPETPKPPSLATLLCAIMGTISKKKNMRKVQALRKRGFIVVCDRWPQNQTFGINDGPLLAAYKKHDKGLYRKLALWEEKQFASLSKAKNPDILFRLIPSLDVVLSRKLEDNLNADMIEQKIESIKKLRFDNTIELHEINADESLVDVLAGIRKIIWAHLLKRPLALPKFYECVGLSGAGKTTISKEFCETGDFKSAEDIFAVHVLSISEKIVLTFRSFFYDPFLYVLILKLVFEIKAWRNIVALKGLFKIPVQKLRLSMAIEKNPYFLEQLFLQNIWTVLMSLKIQTIRPKHLSPLIKRLYRNTGGIILYFDIDTSQAGERVSKRLGGKSRFDGLPANEVTKQLKKASTLIEDIMTAATYAGLDIIHIDASQPALDIVKQIRQTENL